MRATIALFKKLSKVNNSPLGENLPNLVTLVVYRVICFGCNATKLDIIFCPTSNRCITLSVKKRKNQVGH
jgi:hypothetical protein